MSYVTTEWWSPMWKGLVADKSGKHYQRMGPALWLYLYLHGGADTETGKLERKYQTIHAQTGIPVRNLQRMMKRLEKFGYIEITRLAKSMVIQITKWRSISSADNGGSQEVIRHFCPSDPPLLTSAADNGGSQRPSKQKVKATTSADNGGSNESPLTKPKDIYKIFTFWNDQNITQHREIEKFKSCILARLKSYKPEEIIQSIQNYRDILESADHYYSHRFRLDTFLKRTGVLDEFLDRDKAFKNYQKNSNGNGSDNDSGYEPSEAELREREEKIKRGSEKYEKEIGVGA